MKKELHLLGDKFLIYNIANILFMRIYFDSTNSNCNSITNYLELRSLHPDWIKINVSVIFSYRDIYSLHLKTNYWIILNTILLFIALPSSVLLSATGLLFPKPTVVSLFAAIPLETRNILTVSALLNESLLLYSTEPI